MKLRAGRGVLTIMIVMLSLATASLWWVVRSNQQRLIAGAAPDSPPERYMPPRPALERGPGDAVGGCCISKESVV